jgi:hypothetical protein
MKASQVIKELALLIDNRGDCEVRINEEAELKRIIYIDDEERIISIQYEPTTN